MAALVFNKCCFCIDLRVGCLVIGYLNLVAEIILMIFGLMGLVAGGAAMSVSADAEDKEAIQTAGSLFMVMSIIIIILTLIFFAFTIALLIGVHQHKRGPVKAYLIGTAIILTLMLIGTLASIGSNTASETVRGIIQIAISIYFLLCVRSYYYKMEEKPHYAGNA